MFETFQSLDTMLQVYWILAIISSTIFAVQLAGTLMGFAGDAGIDMDIDTDTPDIDSDFDTEGFHLVSVKTVICFILGFGWTGVLCWDAISNPVLLGLVATVVGAAFMSLIAWLLWQILKLDRNNTFRVKQTIGLVAEVYLRIPANKADTGKIQVSLHGSTHELEALTADDTDIPTGAQVRIVSLASGETVEVTKA